MSRYPRPRRDPTTSHWHGMDIPDPYRWLENIESVDTKEWLAAQQRLLDATLANYPSAARIADAIERTAHAFRLLGPAIRGGKSLFFAATDRQTGVAVYRASIDGASKPERLPPYRDMIPLPDHVFPSPSGRFLAVGVRAPANEATSIVIFDTHRGAYLPDATAPSLLPTVAWKPDETGFYYNAIRGVHWMQGTGEPTSALCLHHLGATKEEVILSRPWSEGTALFPFIAAEGRHLIVQVTRLFDGRTGILAARLATPKVLEEILPERSTIARAFGERGGEIYLATTNDAGQSAILAITAANKKVRTILSLEADELKLGISVCATPAILTDSGIAVVRQWAGEDHLSFYAIDGKKSCETKFPVPIDISSVQHVENGTCVLMAQSFLEPATLVVCDSATGKTSAFSSLWQELQPSGVSFERSTFRSDNDATGSMITIKGPAAQRTGRTLVHAYGGISAVLGPKFSRDLKVWIELGGTAVIVHARGGGEYGAAWHRAGAGSNKTNTFSDLRRALETLIEAGAKARQIVVRTKSLGGLLSGFAYNNYPHLMAGIISEMPLLAPLETLVSKQGGHMRKELGDPAKDRTTFERIYAYSPLENLAPSDRKPAHLVVAGDRDERAFAGWIYKYVASAQYVAREAQEVLLMNLEGAAHTHVPPDLAHALLVNSMTFALRVTDEAVR